LRCVLLDDWSANRLNKLQVEPEPQPLRNKLPRDAKKRGASRDSSRDVSRDRSQLTRSIDSEDLLFNFSEDDEMDRINRKALLGTYKEVVLIVFSENLFTHS